MLFVDCARPKRRAYRMLQITSRKQKTPPASNHWGTRGSRGLIRRYEGYEVVHLEFIVRPHRQFGAEMLLHIEIVAFVVICKLFVQRMLFQRELLADKGPDSPELKNALGPIHDLKLVRRHQIFTEFLIVFAEGWGIAPCFAVGIRVDCLLPKFLRERF